MKSARQWNEYPFIIPKCQDRSPHRTPKSAGSKNNVEKTNTLCAPLMAYLIKLSI